MESESEVAQSCPTLRDPMDCSLPGSSVHGIFQVRVLEWGARTSKIRMVSQRCSKPDGSAIIIPPPGNPKQRCFPCCRFEQDGVKDPGLSVTGWRCVNAHNRARLFPSWVLSVQLSVSQIALAWQSALLLGMRCHSRIVNHDYSDYCLHLRHIKRPHEGLSWPSRG